MLLRLTVPTPTEPHDLLESRAHLRGQLLWDVPFPGLSKILPLHVVHVRAEFSAGNSTLVRGYLPRGIGRIADVHLR
jgi:hypothetical protein